MATDHSPYSVGLTNYGYELLDKYADAIVTRFSHSHPGPFGVRTFHPAVPSGFDTVTLKPENRRGDRTNYDRGNKYKDRRPEYYEVYIPGNPKVNVRYNGQEAIRTFKP